MPRTLFDKIWDSHVGERLDDGTCILYIDRHLVYEVSSPQAFAGLRASGLRVRRPSATLTAVGHNIPTSPRSQPIDDPESRLQFETPEANVAAFGVPYIPIRDVRQGIVHIIGPELGLTLPGTTIVCGDSQTSTYGAFAWGCTQVEAVKRKAFFSEEKKQKTFILLSRVYLVT